MLKTYTKLFNFVLQLHKFTCVDSAWNSWKQAFTQICDRQAPIITTRVRNIHNPWVTNEIIKVMYKRDYAHKKAQQAKTDNNLWEEYKRLRKYYQPTMHHYQNAF